MSVNPRLFYSYFSRAEEGSSQEIEKAENDTCTLTI